MLAPILLTFVMVLAVFAAIYWLGFARPQAVEHRQLHRRLRPTRLEEVDEEHTIVDRPPGAERAPLDELLSRTGGPVRVLELAIERAGMTLGVSSLVAMCVSTAVAKNRASTRGTRWAKWCRASATGMPKFWRS